MAKKARTTQNLVNSFPTWASIRKDEQSLGYQFMNSIGNLVDDLKKQNTRIGRNYFLPSSIVSDIDVYYSMQLPDSYVFEKLDGDETELLFTTPTVSGISNNISYNIPLATDNTVEEFWYIHPPDRISLGETVTGTQTLVASGYVNQSPLSLLTVSGILHKPNRLTVSIEGGVSFFDLTDDNYARRAVVQLEGVTRAGLNIVEEVSMVHDDTVQTIHEFEKLTEDIKVYGITDADAAFVRVESAQFGKEDYAVGYEDIDKSFLNNDMQTFWAIGSGVTAGQYTLDYRTYQVDDLELRLDGWTDKMPLFQIELLDEDSNNFEPTDMAIEPNSNRLWVVSSGLLMAYSDELPYPNTSLLDGKDYSASSLIEPSSYYVVLGEEVELDYVWVRPVQGMVKHRVSVVKPDATQFSVEDGVEVTYHTDDTSWQFGEPVNRIIRPSDIFTLDQRGDWVYTLEVQYADGTSSTDKRIVTVASRTPLVQFDLTLLGLSNKIVGVDFDSEEKLWVQSIDDNVYEIYRHHDIMIIDFDKKILYFHENYDQVRVF